MPSRPRAWSDQRILIASLVAGTPQKFDLLENAPALDTHTVIRIIGHLTFMYSPNSTVVDSLSVVDVGIGVSSVEAFAVAAGAGLPAVESDSKYPPRGWLYMATRPVSQQTGDTFEGSHNEQATFDFDVRAMRKIDKGILFLLMEQNNVLVGGSMRVVGRVRALCLN